MSIERATAILTLLRGETTYEVIAAEFGVSLDEVRQWETEFIHAGARSLNGDSQPQTTDTQDENSEHSALSALNSINESLSAAQQSNARFDAIFDATTDGIIVWDDNRRILMVNPAASRILGIRAETLVGEDEDKIPYFVARIAQATKDEQIEFPNKQFGVCRNLRWRSDQASGYLTIIHDITSQIALEEAREETASMLVHDLRSPLSSMVSGIDLARSTLADSEENKEIMTFLNAAYRGGNLLLDMVNSLLDIAMLEAGSMPLDLDPLDVDSIFEEVIGFLSSSAKASQLTLTVEKAEKFPTVRGDSDMIRRAISNLVDNALKFTPSGGHIILSAQPESPNAIRFSVTDNGPGVPEKFRERIFEKYTKVPGQAGRRKGTGLGLAFCRLVAEVHRGQLWVEPRASGGSIFILIVADVNNND
jgi:NtrC-family two-component system sensor histidine kinase KinB